MKRTSLVLSMLLFICLGPISLFAQEGTAEGTVDPSMVEETQQRFTISGFIAFNATKNFIEDDSSTIASVVSKDFSFALNSLHMYFNFNAGNNLRAFSEIRYTFIPSGERRTDYSGFPTIITQPVDNDATDATNVGFDWGTINIERAFIEWNRFGFASLRVGRLLTPYGIYSKDHAATLITSFRQPNTVIAYSGTAGIPAGITGFELLGQVEIPGLGILTDYSIYVANDNVNGEESVIDQFGDDKAFGGFLNFQTPQFGNMLTVDFGTSFYRGKNIDLYQINSTAGGEQFSKYQTDTVLQAHVKLTMTGLPLQGEFVLQGEFEYYWVDEDDSKILVSALGAPVAAENYDGYALYGQLQYTMWNKVTPYFRYEYTLVGDDSIHYVVEKINAYISGLNLKPLSNLVLKLEYAYWDLNSKGNNPFTGLPENNDYWQLKTQVALQF